MDKQDKIKAYLAMNKDKFPDTRILEIEAMLNKAPEDKLYYFSVLELKDPTTMLLIAIFGGSIGIDRFLLGDTTNGVLKLILTNLCLVGIIWVIIDIFNVTKRTKEYNFKQFRDIYTFNVGDSL